MKYIMDPVHGQIRLSSEECNVVDHPIFQRLRYIKQTDVLYLTFSGATHSRFSHSIGAMHIGTRMYDQMIPVDLYINANKRIQQGVWYLRKILRLALLLHDTGHAPFSHLFERVTGKLSFLYEKERRQQLWSNPPSEIVSALSFENHKLSHEDFSLAAAYKILDDCNYSSSTIIDVLSVMDGLDNLNVSEDFKSASECLFKIFEWGDRITHKGSSMKGVLKNIVSGEIDADKIDYLQRDSRACGVGYGEFDVEGIIRSLELSYDSVDMCAKISISPKSIASLCDLVSSRYDMYTQISNNVSNNGVEIVFSFALGELAEKSNFRAMCDISMGDLSCFAFFLDDVIVSEIAKHAQTHPSSFCAMFLRRERLKVASYSQNYSYAEALKFCRNVESNNSGKDLHSKITKIKFSSIKNGYREIMVRSPGEDSELKEIASMTDFFHAPKKIFMSGCYFLP